MKSPSSPSIERLYPDLLAVRERLRHVRSASSSEITRTLGNVAEAVRPALLLSSAPDEVALFDPSFYALRNTDVREARIDPWLHFQLYGVRELRDPHPAVCSDWLARFIPERTDVGVLDQYLLDPRYWLIRPSPGIDLEGFAKSGRWSGVRHPLIEALSTGALFDWVVRTGANDDGDQELLREATLFLSSRHPGISASTDEVVDRSEFVPSPSYRVFPGVGVANEAGQFTILGDAPAASRDDVAVAAGRVISWCPVQILDAGGVVLLPPLTCPTLTELSRLSAVTLLVPGDDLTERALRVAQHVVPVPVHVWHFRKPLRVRTESLRFGIPHESASRSALRWPLRRRSRITVTPDSEAVSTTMWRNAGPGTPSHLEIGVEGLALLASVRSGRLRLSKDLRHVRPLLTELVEHAV